MVSFGKLKEEDTWFELSPRQRSNIINNMLRAEAVGYIFNTILGHFEAAQRLNSMLRNNSHSLQQLLWKSGYQSLFGDMPSRYNNLIMKIN